MPIVLRKPTRTRVVSAALPHVPFQVTTPRGDSSPLGFPLELDTGLKRQKLKKGPLSIGISRMFGVLGPNKGKSVRWGCCFGHKLSLNSPSLPDYNQIRAQSLGRVPFPSLGQSQAWVLPTGRSMGKPSLCAQGRRRASSLHPTGL